MAQRNEVEWHEVYGLRSGRGSRCMATTGGQHFFQVATDAQNLTCCKLRNLLSSLHFCTRFSLILTLCNVRTVEPGFGVRRCDGATVRDRDFDCDKVVCVSKYRGSKAEDHHHRRQDHNPGDHSTSLRNLSIILRIAPRQ